VSGLRERDLRGRATNIICSSGDPLPEAGGVSHRAGVSWCQSREAHVRRRKSTFETPKVKGW